MFKVYKQTLKIGGNTRQASDSLITRNKLSQWLMLPAALAGAVVGTIVFSVFFLAVLLPVGFLAYRAFAKARKATESPIDESLEAEYTVISESEAKSKH